MEWLMNMQVLNLQMIYSGYGCTQGWFCTTCSAAPRARWGPTHRVNPSNFCGPKGCCKYMKVTVLCSRWTPSYSSKLWGLKDSSSMYVGVWQRNSQYCAPANQKARKQYTWLGGDWNSSQVSSTYIFHVFWLVNHG
jgi:hypothetical protein